MSIWPSPGSSRGLRSAEGVLLFIRISVEPRLIEELLDVLARLSFPVNPEIRHADLSQGGRRRLTTIEFPAYENRVSEVREQLRRCGFDPASLRVVSMLDEIQGAGERVSAA